MAKNKFVFNIDGKEVVKEPKEALKILKKDYEDVKSDCAAKAREWFEGLELLETIKILIEAAKEDIKKASKKSTVISKKGTKPSKIEKPAKKAVKAVKKAKKTSKPVVKQVKKAKKVATPVKKIAKKQIKSTKKGK